MTLECLEPRDCPSAFVLVRGGTRPVDIEQGTAGDCAFLSVLAGAAGQRLDLLSRLHHVGPQQWRVDLFPASVPVRFTGRLTPLDPTPHAGEYWPVLFARAHRKLSPLTVTQGETLESAGLTLLGHLPSDDRSVKGVGLEAIRDALSRGSVVVCCSDVHAYAVLRVAGGEVVLYDPWGRVRRIPPLTFLNKPFEVAII